MLLRNERVIYGTATQVGEFVIIDKGNHSRLRLPRTEVSCWASSARHLYQYRLDHRKDLSFSAYLDDAKWCIEQGLYQDAEKELQNARLLAPSDARIDRLEDQLARLSLPVRQAPPMVKQVELHQPSATPTSEAADPIVSSPTSVELFSRSVQRTFMTKCGRCHGSNAKSQYAQLQWKIKSPTGHARASAETTLTNLSGSLPFVDSYAPQRSPLLTKAITAHGGVSAPLGPRHQKAINSLKDWLKHAAQDLKAHNDSIANQIDRQAPLASPASNQPEQQIATLPGLKSPATRRAPHLPQRMPSVENPFDPEIFNRQHAR